MTMMTMMMMMMMMMMMPCLSWLRFRAKPRHLPYIYIYTSLIYLCIENKLMWFLNRQTWCLRTLQYAGIAILGRLLTEACPVLDIRHRPRRSWDTRAAQARNPSCEGLRIMEVVKSTIVPLDPELISFTESSIVHNSKLQIQNSLYKYWQLICSCEEGSWRGGGFWSWSCGRLRPTSNVPRRGTAWDMITLELEGTHSFRRLIWGFD